MKKEHASLACGIIGAIGIVGALVGTLSSYITYHFSAFGWEWRIPFLFTFLLGIPLFYSIAFIKETPEFLKHKEEAQIKRIPLIDIMKNHNKIIFSTACIACIPASMFYLSAVYVPNFLIDQQEVFSPSQTLGISVLAQGLCVFFNPLLGAVADKIGKELVLKIGSFLMIVGSLFLFSYIFSLEKKKKMAHF